MQESGIAILIVQFLIRRLESQVLVLQDYNWLAELNEYHEDS